MTYWNVHQRVLWSVRCTKSVQVTNSTADGSRSPLYVGVYIQCERLLWLSVGVWVTVREVFCGSLSERHRETLRGRVSERDTVWVWVSERERHSQREWVSERDTKGVPQWERQGVNTMWKYSMRYMVLYGISKRRGSWG